MKKSQGQKKEKQKLCYEGIAFFQARPIYRIHRVHGENNKIANYAIIFDLKRIDKEGLSSVFEYNKEVMKNARQLKKGKNLLKIKTYLRKGDQSFFIVEPFDKNLKNYIDQNPLTEKKVINIFTQVLESVYSIFQSKYTCINIRPEHFVKVQDHWKLKSLVYTNKIKKAFSSQFLWDSDYQPPEAYEKTQFTDDQLDEMIVWNLGSILLDLICGKHVLDSYQKIQQFTYPKLNFERLQISIKISKENEEFLQKTLAWKPEDRISIKKVFQFSFIKTKIEEALKLNDQIFPQEIPGSLMINSKMRIDSLFLSKFQTTSFLKNSGNLSSQLSKIFEQNSSIKIDSQTQKIIYPEKNGQSEINEIILSENGQNFQSQLVQILSKYQLECGVAEFLTLIANSTTRKMRDMVRQSSNEDQFLLQFMNFFALSFMGLVVINTISQSLNYFQNVYLFENSAWNRFLDSALYGGLKIYIDNLVEKISSYYIEFIDKAQKIINSDELPRDYNDFIQQDFRKTTIEDTKNIYRKILIKTLTKLNSDPKENIREQGLIIYALLFNKVHRKSDEVDNFMQFMRFYKSDIKQFTLKDYKDFMDNAPANLLKKHINHLQEKYFH